MASRYATLNVMASSGHRDDPIPARAPANDQAAAKATLDAAGWGWTEAATAWCRALAANPAAMLALLAPHRPPPKQRGRPRRRAVED